MLEYLSIGQIVNLHGVQGEVKVYPLTDNVLRFKKLKEVYVEVGSELKSFKILEVKMLKNMVVLKLEGIDTVEAALKLKDCYLKVDREKAVKLPKDNYFICDLIDIEVFDIEGKLLGKVSDIIQTGSNDVYIVKNEGKELLIPALKSVFKEINIEDRKIIVELPEGLI